MSKYLSTKEKIIRLLDKRNESMMTLCDKLDLAPSTVSQHLKELTALGYIKPEWKHAVKYKFYELV